MPGSDGITELIDGCLSGDPSSWKAFVDRFSRMVHWAIWRTLDKRPVTGKDEICREVFQDVFTKLLRDEEMRRLRSVDSVPKYLCVVASHLVFDHLRRAERQHRLHNDLEYHASEADTQRTPDQGLVDVEEGERLERAMRELSGREKRCLSLHYGRGKTHRDIALILGVPQDTVSTLIRRAKEKIKNNMEKS